MAAAAAAVTAAPGCSKRESDNVGADLSVSHSPCLPSSHDKKPKKARKGRSPPEEEMEAFFAAAESSVARRFATKYNYDVVKDAPMDGRYEWIRVSP